MIHLSAMNIRTPIDVYKQLSEIVYKKTGRVVMIISDNMINPNPIESVLEQFLMNTTYEYTR